MFSAKIKSLVYYEHHHNDYITEHSHNCYECVFYLNGKGKITESFGGCRLRVCGGGGGSSGNGGGRSAGARGLVAGSVGVVGVIWFFLTAGAQTQNQNQRKNYAKQLFHTRISFLSAP